MVRESVEVGESNDGCGFGFSEGWPDGLKGVEEALRFGQVLASPTPPGPGYDELVEKTQGKRFLYFNEKAFSPDMRRFLEERFPAPCVIKTEQAARHRYHGVCLRTAYANILADASRPAGLAADHRVGFTKATNAMTAEQIQAQLHGRRFLFHDDQGLTEAMKSVLAERYPVKSRFEWSATTEMKPPGDVQLLHDRVSSEARKPPG